MRKNRKARTAASLAVTAVLSVAVFLLFFSIESLVGYFSSHSFRESLRLSGYVTELEADMLEKQKELFASYGLPESLTEEIWGESKTYLAFSQYADDGQVKEDGDDFGQQSVLEEYFEKQGILETEQVQDVIRRIVRESKAICKRYVYPSFVTGYRQFVQERKPVYFGMLAACAVIAALCIVLLFYWYHCRHHALYYITGSFFTATVWNVAGAAVLNTGAWFSVSGVQTPYYEHFLEIYQARGMYPWYVFSGVAAAVTLLLLVVSIRMRNRK